MIGRRGSSTLSQLTSQGKRPELGNYQLGPEAHKVPTKRDPQEGIPCHSENTCGTKAARETSVVIEPRSGGPTTAMNENAIEMVRPAIADDPHDYLNSGNN